jgi:hypothetical protein
MLIHLALHRGKVLGYCIVITKRATPSISIDNERVVCSRRGFYIMSKSNPELRRGIDIT